ncbi:hypothetical protein PROFUN_00549 [Planoprotostelium fungivorum]|uniref:Uncharacterized protein n=1 Tax=Planoprotostelium fungivorum TaxID=1890364 RepID=A0A2P6N145_9EUKA|nr:hypothetical protein PROFUN_00549 [Planoprotostelium fungivorum]
MSFVKITCSSGQLMDQPRISFSRLLEFYRPSICTRRGDYTIEMKTCPSGHLPQLLCKFPLPVHFYTQKSSPAKTGSFAFGGSSDSITKEWKRSSLGPNPRN